MYYLDFWSKEGKGIFAKNKFKEKYKDIEIIEDTYEYSKLRLVNLDVTIPVYNSRNGIVTEYPVSDLQLFDMIHIERGVDYDNDKKIIINAFIRINSPGRIILYFIKLGKCDTTGVLNKLGFYLKHEEFQDCLNLEDIILGVSEDCTRIAILEMREIFGRPRNTIAGLEVNQCVRIIDYKADECIESKIFHHYQLGNNKAVLSYNQGIITQDIIDFVNEELAKPYVPFEWES